MKKKMLGTSFRASTGESRAVPERFQSNPLNRADHVNMHPALVSAK